MTREGLRSFAGFLSIGLSPTTPLITVPRLFLLEAAVMSSDETSVLLGQLQGRIRFEYDWGLRGY